MSEFVEKQVRLLLEQQAAATFTKLYSGSLTRHHFTLIAFDFGDSGNVAFKTSLRPAERVDTFQALIGSWEGGPVRFAPQGLRPTTLRDLADAAKQEFQAGIGFVMVVGDALESAYVSNAERSDVAKIIRAELLPHWAEEAGAT